MTDNRCNTAKNVTKVEMIESIAVRWILSGCNSRRLYIDLICYVAWAGRPSIEKMTIFSDSPHLSTLSAFRARDLVILSSQSSHKSLEALFTVRVLARQHFRLLEIFQANGALKVFCQFFLDRRCHLTSVEEEGGKENTNTFPIFTEHGGKSVSMQEKLLRFGRSNSSLMEMKEAG